ncbi:hypothetical protein HAX54_022192, partial [Datura stramonium]|nr:hypothetical protein [Datura stramonium]
SSNLCDFLVGGDNVLSGELYVAGGVAELGWNIVEVRLAHGQHSASACWRLGLRGAQAVFRRPGFQFQFK